MFFENYNNKVRYNHYGRRQLGGWKNTAKAGGTNIENEYIIVGF